MVGPQDGGFGFDQSKKYTNVENLDKICVQCQDGQQVNRLRKNLYVLYSVKNNK